SRRTLPAVGAEGLPPYDRTSGISAAMPANGGPINIPTPHPAPPARFVTKMSLLHPEHAQRPTPNTPRQQRLPSSAASVRQQASDIQPSTQVLVLLIQLLLY